MNTLIKVLAIVACAYSALADNIPDIKVIDGGLSGDGITTGYWDCCKPSCGWTENTNLTKPVVTCAKDGVTPVDKDAMSGCGATGTAYPCSNQHCYKKNDTLAYGFTAASFTTGEDFSHCCVCVLMSFKGALAGKSLLAQVINTGAPLAQNQFDLAIPSCGVGVNTQGCIYQWNAPADGWGGQWDSPNAIHTIEGCDQMPEDLQEGCRFRFDFMESVANPDVSFVQVECPEELATMTGCVI